MRKMFMSLVLKFSKTLSLSWACRLCTNSDRKVKINNYTIFLVVTSSTQVWSRKFLICPSRTNGDKSIKILRQRVLSTGFSNFNFNPSSEVIFAKIGSKKAQIWISCAKGDKPKVICMKYRFGFFWPFSGLITTGSQSFKILR